MDTKAQKIIKRADKLKAGRSNWETLWQDCAKYCMPQQANITTTKVTGSAVDTRLYDSTAIDSLQVFASAMHSYLTNPASKWFGLRTKDKELMKDKTVKVWLKQCEDIIYSVLGASNFAQEKHAGYLDLGCFGTSIIYSEEDPKDYVRFYCRPLKEILIAEGVDGRVDTVYRMFKLTARQAFQKWGANSGEAVLKAIEMEDTEKMFDFIHAVEPRHERDVKSKDSKDMPFSSVYVEVTQKHICEEGGYEEFPFFVPRFSKVSGDAYGYSPPMISMPSIRMLNGMSKTVIRSAQKIVDPPVELPHNGYLLPLNLNDGGINFKVQGTADDGIKPILTGGRVDIGLEMLQRYETAIKKAFFVDVFLMMNQDKGQKTATEVNELSSEKMLMVGAVLGRLMSEDLSPNLYRTFGMLARRGALPPIPDALINEDGTTKEYVIEYISPLAKAQKFQEINSINQLMALVGQMAQAFPTVLDLIDSDQTIQDASDIYGVNPELVLDDDEVKAIREQKAEQMQQQQEMAQAQQVAQVAKDGSQAVKNLQPQGQAQA